MSANKYYSRKMHIFSALCSHAMLSLQISFHLQNTVYKDRKMHLCTSPKVIKTMHMRKRRKWEEKEKKTINACFFLYQMFLFFPFFSFQFSYFFFLFHFVCLKISFICLLNVFGILPLIFNLSELSYWVVLLRFISFGSRHKKHWN